MTDTTVEAYVAALMDDGYAPATIKQAAAAPGAGARAQGLDDPRGTLARQALAGAVRHNAGEGRGQVAGLRREDALAAAAAAEGTVSGLRDAALLCTMSDALLRASEVAAIATADIELEGAGGGRLAIRRSKTDQEAEGASGHNCRVGSAQSLIERGASTAAVAIAGRWKDHGMVVRYAKAQEAGRGAVKAYFGGK